MATNGGFEQYTQAPSVTETSEQTTSTNSTHDLSKDEVGWYFVEQYYTTLSKNPEKLHLFYGKRSQFVYGKETEVASVSVGRPAIQERIKELDFQDCKVRVTNVDTLPCFDGIVIQVIGETSMKGEEPKKFAQTFVLAKQPSGYFVLNDIWRYMSEEEEEEQPEEAAQEKVAPETTEVAAPVPEEEAEPEKEEVPQEEASAPLDPDVVDKKLEEVTKDEPAPSKEPVAPEPVPEPATEPAAKPEIAEPTADPDVTAREIEEEDVKEPEKPKDPSPTPVAPTKAPAPAAEPAKPAAPPKPMTWASRLAATTGPKPVVPLPKTATPPAAAQPRAPVPAAQKPAPAPKTEPEPAPETPSSQPAGEGWQTAGADTKRQRPQSMVGSSEKEGTMGYVKYVTEKVQDGDLRAALSSYGALTYFDVNRTKNCAFVEFATAEGYKAAVAANPHVVNGENVVVEQRRPKSTAYGGTQYVPNRGGSSGRGRGGYDGGRAGGQGGPRGAYGTQSRGGRGSGAPRAKAAQQSSS